MYHIPEIKPSWDSFYITGVEPGLDYYCDIITKDGDGEIYPVIYSNTVSAPAERPPIPIDSTATSGFWGAGEYATREDAWTSYSSGAFYKK